MSDTQDIKDLVKEFISLLDVVETTDEGREHRPNRITSYRAMDGERMGQILVTLKSMV